MIETLKYTPTQLAILKVLSDGMAHYRDELQACLPDELASRSALHMHIGKLRKLLRPRGYDIICEYIRRRIHYRHVQLLSQQD